MLLLVDKMFKLCTCTQSKLGSGCLEWGHKSVGMCVPAQLFHSSCQNCYSGARRQSAIIHWQSDIHIQHLTGRASLILYLNHHSSRLTDLKGDSEQLLTCLPSLPHTHTHTRPFPPILTSSSLWPHPYLNITTLQRQPLLDSRLSGQRDRFISNTGITHITSATLQSTKLQRARSQMCYNVSLYQTNAVNFIHYLPT